MNKPIHWSDAHESTEFDDLNNTTFNDLLKFRFEYYSIENHVIIYCTVPGQNVPFTNFNYINNCYNGTYFFISLPF